MTTLPRRASANTSPVRQALCFRLGDVRFALPAHQVTAVAEVTACTRIPSADPALLGVARVGQRFLPLIDAHRRMHVDAGRANALPWTCLVAKGRLGEVVFRIDEVLGLHAAPEGQLPADCVRMSLERVIAGDAERTGGE